MNKLAEGVYPSLNIEEYHADAAVGSSTIKTVTSKSPAHAKNQKKISKQIADYGSAFHMAILEPECFLTEVIRGPEDRRGNKWKDILAENPNKIVLVSSDYDTCLMAEDSLYKSETIRSILKSKVATERSYFWKDKETGLLLKSRPDFEGDNFLLDLKTCESASIRAFELASFKYGYHIQQAHYIEGMSHFEFSHYDFLFLAVEKELPFAWSIYQYDSVSENIAKRKWREGLNLWADCVKKNNFPSYDEKQYMSLSRFYPEGIPAMSGLAKLTA